MVKKKKTGNHRKRGNFHTFELRVTILLLLSSRSMVIGTEFPCAAKSERTTGLLQAELVISTELKNAHDLWFVGCTRKRGSEFHVY